MIKGTPKEGAYVYTRRERLLLQSFSLPSGIPGDCKRLRNRFMSSTETVEAPEVYK